MNVTWWKLKNRWRNRKQPKGGGGSIAVVVTRKDGRVENLGTVGRATVEMTPEAK